MKSWLIFGRDSKAIGPSIDLLTGTSLLQIRARLSESKIDLILAMSLCNKCEENIWATPNNSGSSMPSSFFRAFWKNFLFRSNKRPQPSPVFPSEPIAPRWVMLVRPTIDLFTTSLFGVPWRLTIKPKPQLSLAWLSLYSDMFFLWCGM